MRRLATLILLLAVPLRVYAAAAMMLCSPASGGTEAGPVAHARHHEAHAFAHLHHAASAHGVSAHDDAAADSHSADPNAASFHAHVSCSGCPCAGMIATASFAWKPQAFPAPTISSFIVNAVPSTVPHRLERPPRTILA